MLRICRELFDDWNGGDILYCHWKSNEHLNEGLEGTTDLDVLLSADDREKAENSLHKLDFLHCKSQFGARYPGVQDWIGFDRDTGRLIHLHLHFEMVTGHKGMKEYSLPWAEEVLQTRIQDSASLVFVSDPTWELLTLYTRIGLKASPRQVRKARKNRYALSEDVAREIQYLKKRFDAERLTVIVERYYGESAGRMLQLMNEESASSKWFLSLVDTTEKAMRKACRYSKCSVFFRKWYFILYSRFLEYLKYHRGKEIILRKVPYSGKGLSVAFLGQDGSGKSTVSKEITKWLSWKLDVKKYYLGNGEDFSCREKKGLERLKENKSFIAKCLKGILSLGMFTKVARNGYKSARRAVRYANQGGIAIYDRFPQNKYPGIQDGPKIRSALLRDVQRFPIVRSYARWSAGREERLIAKTLTYPPQIVIKLMLPVEVSMLRKPGENREMVSRKHDIIQDCHFSGSREYVVDATQDYRQEIIQIKQIIWDNLPK